MIQSVLMIDEKLKLVEARFNLTSVLLCNAKMCRLLFRGLESETDIKLYQD